MVGSRLDIYHISEESYLNTHIQVIYVLTLASYFVNDFFFVTVNVEGIGTVCSYSCFDFDR